ncbi:MarR family transcriptional regulator [Nakamurella sp. YIM 132087]|uniref:MarR family transcriptional regulator n=1 Tax=Nakamurella alba TaxID=2665158 RepID=A0A7K1FQS8_9ACTN|nr:MarR family winged helix-turn-helix transcriptional regulator [Nakamurella alba]MTD15603.1 MarR family transcriptional regulator [Nakamurella alba]
MVPVKSSDIPEGERHVAVLLGGLLQGVRDAFDPVEWGGLRQSHFRVISSVPAGGISVTELAERVGMTKQGCGQFVAQLVASGHLTSEPGPVDARVRIVRRTPLGEENVVAVTARMDMVEQAWRERVGDRRYATFRKVLEQLADA